ncbi:MAG: hypothetical protein AAFO07_10950, partial [Bacteroidota bacterium]
MKPYHLVLPFMVLFFFSCQINEENIHPKCPQIENVFYNDCINEITVDGKSICENAHIVYFYNPFYEKRDTITNHDEIEFIPPNRIRLQVPEELVGVDLMIGVGFRRPCKNSTNDNNAIQFNLPCEAENNCTNPINENTSLFPYTVVKDDWILPPPQDEAPPSFLAGISTKSISADKADIFIADKARYQILRIEDDDPFILKGS